MFRTRLDLRDRLRCSSDKVGRWWTRFQVLARFKKRGLIPVEKITHSYVWYIGQILNWRKKEKKLVTCGNTICYAQKANSAKSSSLSAIIAGMHFKFNEKIIDPTILLRFAGTCRAARFFLTQCTKMGGNIISNYHLISKGPQNIPNYYKIYKNFPF
jgi:hypothetical protein